MKAVAVKVNFTIPEQVIEALKERVHEQGRSAVVAEAISE